MGWASFLGILKGLGPYHMNREFILIEIFCKSKVIVDFYRFGVWLHCKYVAIATFLMAWLTGIMNRCSLTWNHKSENAGTKWNPRNYLIHPSHFCRCGKDLEELHDLPKITIKIWVCRQSWRQGHRIPLHSSVQMAMYMRCKRKTRKHPQGEQTAPQGGCSWEMFIMLAVIKTLWGGSVNKNQCVIPFLQRCPL